MENMFETYINSHSKSQLLGFLLTLVFGPLGLFYSNWIAGLILCLITFTSAASFVGPIVCWLLAIILSFFTVNNYNNKVRMTAGLINVN